VANETGATHAPRALLGDIVDVNLPDDRLDNMAAAVLTPEEACASRWTAAGDEQTLVIAAAFAATAAADRIAAANEADDPGVELKEEFGECICVTFCFALNEEFGEYVTSLTCCFALNDEFGEYVTSATCCVALKVTPPSAIKVCTSVKGSGEYAASVKCCCELKVKFGA